MKIPQYVIDQAKWRILDRYGDFDIQTSENQLKRAEEDVSKSNEKLVIAKQFHSDCVNLKNELIEWLKSIGEYETREQSNS